MNKDKSKKELKITKHLISTCTKGKKAGIKQVVYKTEVSKGKFTSVTKHEK